MSEENLVRSINVSKEDGRMSVTVVFADGYESFMSEIYSSEKEYRQRLGSALESLIFYKAPEGAVVSFKYRGMGCSVVVNELRLGGVAPELLVSAINHNALVIHADSVYSFNKGE